MRDGGAAGGCEDAWAKVPDWRDARRHHLRQ